MIGYVVGGGLVVIGTWGVFAVAWGAWRPRRRVDDMKIKTEGEQ